MHPGPKGPGFTATKRDKIRHQFANAVGEKFDEINQACKILEGSGVKLDYETLFPVNDELDKLLN